jgi:hypothetical protein
MKRCALLFVVFFGIQVLFAQQESAFDGGEWLKFRLSYSGWMKAGNAVLRVEEDTLHNKAIYHVVGKGWTTGAIKWFFKVEDHYESYIDQNTGLPQKFVRDIDEGGYTKHRIIEFDHLNNKAHVDDIKYNTNKTYDIKTNVQDLVSAYYYLRNNYKTDALNRVDEVNVNIFFDDENFDFKLKFLGRDVIKTNFGKIKCLKFRPYVLAGRVFKEEESLTLWVSADKNKIPLKIKADLRVGSLRADLVALKGLKYPFEIQF